MDDAFQDGVDLPWGPYGERLTAYDDPLTFLTLEMENAEVVATTASGWPTVIVGERDGAAVGVAIAHVTQLNDKPAEEIDVFVDAAHNWWALVEFDDLDAARAGGRYTVRGYEGYDVLPFERHAEGFELFTEYADRKETPIFEMADDAAAFAIQRASSYGTLEAMFDLETYSELGNRQQRLERATLSREEWLDKNSLTGIARDLSDSTDE